MTAYRTTTDKPPSPPIMITAKGEAISRKRTALGGHRGRPSHEEYEKLASSVLRREAFQLEDCTMLAQLPGVQQLARRLKGSVFPTGTAIRFLLDRAAMEVEQHTFRQRDVTSQRIAVFLHIWYGEQGTTVAVADALGVSRSLISHCVQPQSVTLVAKRFLELAWRFEVPT